MIAQEILQGINPHIVVSYGLMLGGGGNPMGHAYLLFSYYCPESKKMVVNDAIGFYSSPLPEEYVWRRKITPFGFFDKGHLLQEQYRHIIDDGSQHPLNHFHKSWQISPEQYTQIIQKINTDRGKDSPLKERNFSQEHTDYLSLKALPKENKKKTLQEIQIKETEENKKAQGPDFDIIHRSCKTDALKRLAAIGINTQGIHNRFIDVPISSGKISQHSLSYDESIQKMTWDTPLILSPQKEYSSESPAMQTIFSDQRKYELLMNNLTEMIETFKLKSRDLSYKNKSELAKILNSHQQALQSLFNTIKTNGLNPKHICSTHINTYLKQYEDIITQAKISLKPFSIKDNRLKLFIKKISDIFIDLCTQFARLFYKPNTLIYSEAYLLNKAENNLSGLKRKLS